MFIHIPEGYGISNPMLIKKVVIAPIPNLQVTNILLSQVLMWLLIVKQAMIK